MNDFLTREVPALGGRKVFRLGLASNYGIDEKGVRAAIDHGINYFFYTFRSGQMKSPLQDAIAKDRESIIIATLPLIGFFGGSIRRGAERALKHLGTDYLDVFQLGWLGVTSAWTESTMRELEHLKESGKVRAIGCSIHDRERAGRLAKDSSMDMLMIRYNAAHPGAERDIFPHCEARKPMVVAYTATSWRKLLKKPKKWDGPVMTGGDCYRFCLSNEHVDVTLCGPSSQAQLEENLAGLSKGPLAPDEATWMRAFGKAVHG